MSLQQARYFHGVILKEFMLQMDIEYTPSNLLVVKQMFKRHLSVQHTSELNDKEYSIFIDSTIRVIAEGWGIELPQSQANTEMREFLKLIYSWEGER